MSCDACGESFDSPSRSSISVPRNSMGIQIFCDASCAAFADAMMPETDIVCDAEVVFKRVYTKGCRRDPKCEPRRGLTVTFSPNICSKERSSLGETKTTRFRVRSLRDPAYANSPPDRRVDISPPATSDLRNVTDDEDEKQPNSETYCTAVRFDESYRHDGGNENYNHVGKAHEPLRTCTAHCTNTITNTITTGPDERGIAITAALTRAKPLARDTETIIFKTRSFGQLYPQQVPRSDFGRLFV
jgi:hypothetical protein